MSALRAAATAVALTLTGALPVLAQTVPAGPQVNVQIVTQPNPTMPQFTRVDQPLLRDGLAAKSNGRIRVTLASWPERNLNGPEILRLVRSGQVDIGAVPLNTVAGDVPLLDVIDLAGLNPSLDQARRVAAAMLPEVNKELERFGVRILVMYPFAAQEFFCRGEVKSLADCAASASAPRRLVQRLRHPDRRPADRHRLPRGLRGPRARRRRLCHHGHRVGQFRPLVRGHPEPLRPAALLVGLRLRRERPVVEPPRPGGTCRHGGHPQGGRGSPVEARPGADRGRHRLQHRRPAPTASSAACRTPIRCASSAPCRPTRGDAHDADLDHPAQLGQALWRPLR